MFHTISAEAICSIPIITINGNDTLEEGTALTATDCLLIQNGDYVDHIYIDLPYTTLMIDTSENNTLYSRVGYHKLIQNEANLYTETIDFLIKEENSSVLDNRIYAPNIISTIMQCVLKIIRSYYLNILNFTLTNVENIKYTKPTLIKKLTNKKYCLTGNTFCGNFPSINKKKKCGVV